MPLQRHNSAGLGVSQVVPRLVIPAMIAAAGLGLGLGSIAVGGADRVPIAADTTESVAAAPVTVERTTVVTIMSPPPPPVTVVHETVRVVHHVRVRIIHHVRVIVRIRHVASPAVRHGKRRKHHGGD